MELDVITVAFFLLALLAIAFGIWGFVACLDIKEQDIPVTYEDTDFSEWPYIENYQT